MTDQVLIPLNFAIKAIRFLDKSAGEGFVFDPNTPEELDAGLILYDWFNTLPSGFPLWLPDDVKDNWE